VKWAEKRASSGEGLAVFSSGCFLFGGFGFLGVFFVLVFLAAKLVVV